MKNLFKSKWEKIGEILNKRPFSKNKKTIVKIQYRDRKNIEIIKKAYNYRCQYCGYKFMNEKGNYICHVAHIVPHSISRDNRLENVFVLCPNHHAEFDSGLQERKEEIYTKIKRKYRKIDYNEIFNSEMQDELKNLMDTWNKGEFCNLDSIHLRSMCKKNECFY